MRGKELVLKAFKNEKLSRAPWVPYVGVHGAKLINCSTQEYMSNPTMMLAGIRKAIELYKPDGIPIVFDLQFEAEILGCKIKWEEKLPPIVESHPLLEKSISELPEFTYEKGRFWVLKKVLTTIKKEIGSEIALYGLVTGPLTLLFHLLGNSLILDMMNNKNKIRKLLTYCSGITKSMAKFYLDNGADVIAVVDPMLSLISDTNFNEFMSLELNRIFEYIESRASFSSLFVCGDATNNLESMFQTDCDNIAVDDCVELSYLKKLSLKYNKSIGGNINLTKTLLFGSKRNVINEVLKCLDIGKNKGYILSPGCDIPFDSPIEHLEMIPEVVKANYYDFGNAKYKDSNEKSNEINYDQNKLVIEIFTIDSLTCPPCKYMLESVKEAISIAENNIEAIEIKTTSKSGYEKSILLGIDKLPAICFNGKLMYSSEIPNIKELQEEISYQLSQL